MKGFKSVGHDKQPNMNINKGEKKGTYNLKDNRSEKVNEILEKYRSKHGPEFKAEEKV